VHGTILVVAGLIEREGKILIGQRKSGSRHALKWEFPGGKVERGETAAQALVRELCEELSIEAEAGAEIAQYGYQYPNRLPISLTFLRVARYTGEPRNLVFEQIRWETRDRLPDYDFLDGDTDFVHRLVRGEFA
jgi:8-oxo-dGTP diphosphatase